MSTDLQAKILANVTVKPNGCWEWSGFCTGLGYGEIAVKGKSRRAHRVAYEAFKGPIPPRMRICHRCDNPPCCNPEHLFPGTAKDNTQDSLKKGRHYSASKTHCKRGHVYAEHAWKDSTGKRHCRACDRIRNRKRAGWPEELALSLPATPMGHRPVNINVLTKPERRANKLRTECIHGHPLSGDNLYITPDGRRQCRACRVISVRGAIERRKKAA